MPWSPAIRQRLRQRRPLRLSEQQPPNKFGSERGPLVSNLFAKMKQGIIAAGGIVSPGLAGRSENAPLRHRAVVIGCRAEPQYPYNDVLVGHQ
jgi:hypothetical protein